MSLLGGLISQGVGGLLANRAAKKARANSIADQLANGERTREAAERGGFNPLTYLQATGGGGGPSHGSGSIPALASVGFIQNAIQGVDDAITQHNSNQNVKKNHSLNLMNIEANSSRGLIAANVPATVASRSAGHVAPTPFMGRSFPPVSSNISASAPLRYSGLASGPSLEAPGPAGIETVGDDGTILQSFGDRHYRAINGTELSYSGVPVAVLEEEGGEHVAGFESLIRLGPHMVNRMQDVGSGMMAAAENAVNRQWRRDQTFRNRTDLGHGGMQAPHGFARRNPFYSVPTNRPDTSAFTNRSYNARNN